MNTRTALIAVGMSLLLVGCGNKGALVLPAKPTPADTAPLDAAPAETTPAETPPVPDVPVTPTEETTPQPADNGNG